MADEINDILSNHASSGNVVRATRGGWFQRSAGVLLRAFCPWRRMSVQAGMRTGHQSRPRIAAASSQAVRLSF
ncbi:MAG: hypothetical protein K6A82_07675 [Prevotella sp.]|nr:hypothetical protein [Prevotella sp.]